ncbi:MAG TPA: phasin family protein [Acetobacteraceae bacterium]|nr:phasin family protein [Acetobacteraceae bacterium]
MANPSEARRTEAQERGTQENGTARVRAATDRTVADMREATASGTAAMAEFVAPAATAAPAELPTPERIIAPVAEAGLDQGRRMMEAMLRVTDLYREANDRTADDMQAMFSSISRCAGGMQHWQRACFDLMQQSFDRMSQRHQALWSIRSPVEWAEFHRDAYIGSVQAVFTAQTMLLQLAARLAQEAVQPLEERARDGAQG